jgi:hypothetical protein
VLIDTKLGCSASWTPAEVAQVWVNTDRVHSTAWLSKLLKLHITSRDWGMYILVIQGQRVPVTITVRVPRTCVSMLRGMRMVWRACLNTSSSIHLHSEDMCIVSFSIHGEGNGLALQLDCNMVTHRRN